MDRLLSIPEVAAATGFNEAKVRQLCRLGKLKAVDSGTGKRHVFHVSETNLNRFINGEAGEKQIATPVVKKSGRRSRIDHNVQQIF